MGATTDNVPTFGFFPDWRNISGYEIPIDMRFNAGHVVSIVFYSILFVFSAIGNITVLSIILRRRRNSSSRINTMLMHLAIADLLVTFLMMPLEIVWAATVAWWAGDVACRITAFFRIFGLYLSSFVLICISIDRYFAVLKPMNLSDVDRRGKVMLTCAWVGSTICSTPQAFVFHVENHPNVTWYHQCVHFGAFSSPTHELAYFFFGMIMMYGLPLLVIIFSYASILGEIYRRSREPGEGFRRSSLGFLGRAKSRTLKMTITIVFVFFVCWTPYYVMCVWHWLFPASAKDVDQRVQRGLFLFACTNSCMNPIVYGAFNIRTRRRTPGQVRGRSVSSTAITCATDIRLPALSISLRNVE
ncbi:adipokinetic hormone/corazonin-related peptide receptor variant I-like [Macrosteles quadrilineatus]|uniref:adipokinetic hormone/corazonin-related peptide receptor variant I-like n=1 Tax=Macrosteles quadrilineatus TaxID=74068 RepID=UPI0023E33FBF|nr:adipokinetic hormone/corazonin-related peptide receptor variant I-like [Macrosteles quadrilineatus]XP_054277218.1 adipokinetic hormone/corazonin-related peptide receptor variant I-like [Macrosteles quadrilineatus]XP_054277219.1 adipokinetic hormone/corazonin-related peptide receptor variant I-like [Macrosteles quadrilineatus]